MHDVDVSPSVSRRLYSWNTGTCSVNPSASLICRVRHSIFVRDGCSPRKKPISTVAVVSNTVLRRNTLCFCRVGTNSGCALLNSCIGRDVVIVVRQAYVTCVWYFFPIESISVYSAASDSVGRGESCLMIFLLSLEWIMVVLSMDRISWMIVFHIPYASDLDFAPGKSMRSFFFVLRVPLPVYIFFGLVRWLSVSYVVVMVAFGSFVVGGGSAKASSGCFAFVPGVVSMGEGGRCFVVVFFLSGEGLKVSAYADAIVVFSFFQRS